VTPFTSQSTEFFTVFSIGLIHQFLKKSTSEPIRRKYDEVIFKEDEAWERSYSFNPHILCIFFEVRNRRFRNKTL
jgi:hypothetical protein